MNVLITGATSGIGYQLALDYCQKGHRVYAIGRNKDTLSKLTEMGAETVELDLTDYQMVKQALSQLPPLQLVILSAGICQYHHYHHFDGQSFANVVNVNLASIGYILEAIWLKMDSPSQLALIGSLACYLPFTRSGAYSASKAGVKQLANVLRTDLKPRQISVHLIEPGFIDTPMTQANHFKMPFLLSVDKASKLIEQGLIKKRTHIAFPWQLHLMLRVLAKLPMSWQNTICRKLAKRAE
ncbi:SDR family NAD(P)-dependent oxidoreductase [Celerinatantimonas sp. MCCC 1A17872]|uniref:SDR family NAD(P)-dependent oxidoreductase n=1 Tax=Celerinatantimonas sp. MCCC 1A17872 TaxID=3177514 RepID=UPI0038C29A7A